MFIQEPHRLVVGRTARPSGLPSSPVRLARLDGGGVVFAAAAIKCSAGAAVRLSLRGPEA